jgi:hypothetical protein
MTGEEKKNRKKENHEGTQRAKFSNFVPPLCAFFTFVVKFL